LHSQTKLVRSLKDKWKLKETMERQFFRDVFHIRANKKEKDSMNFWAKSNVVANTKFHLLKKANSLCNAYLAKDRC